MCWNQREVNNIADVDCLVIAIVREANIFYRGLGKNIWHDIRSVLAGKPTILRVYELAGTYTGNFEANNFYRVLGKYTN